MDIQKVPRPSFLSPQLCFNGAPPMSHLGGFSLLASARMENAYLSWLSLTSILRGFETRRKSDVDVKQITFLEMKTQTSSSYPFQVHL